MATVLMTGTAMIVASVAGAWLGAGVVAGWPRRRVQVGMGLALLAAAAFFAMTNLGLFPAGGETLSLRSPLLWAALESADEADTGSGADSDRRRGRHDCADCVANGCYTCNDCRACDNRRADARFCSCFRFTAACSKPDIHAYSAHSGAYIHPFADTGFCQRAQDYAGIQRHAAPACTRCSTDDSPGWRERR